MASLFLIGFMGAGKTTLGKELACKLQKSWIDIDQYLEKQFGMTVADYIDRYSMDAFRKAEAEALTQLNAEIISTGGGIVTQKTNLQWLQQQEKVVFLDAPLDVLYHRVKTDQTVRPLAQSKAQFYKLYKERKSLYETCSNYTLATDTEIDKLLKQLEKIITL